MTSSHRIWLCAVLLAVVSNCSLMQRQEPEPEVLTVPLTDTQENQIGRRIHEQLVREGLRLSKDRVVTGYAARVLAQLTPHAAKDRVSKWHVHVIDDQKTVNAFTTPGGHLYIYTGLLLTADNESEVVGVLAHELGHVVSHHAARQLVSQYGQQSVEALALGRNPTLLEQLAAGLMSNGAMLAHSRAEENEADTYAVRYSAQAGYDPRGVAMFFRKLPAKSDTLHKLLSYLETHPDGRDRIEHVNQVIAREHLAGPKVGVAELEPIKQRLTLGAPVSWL